MTNNMKINHSKKPRRPGKQGAAYLTARAADAEKQAEAARKLARLAKTRFKDARKAFKQAKKFAKQARKEAKAAVKALQERSARRKKASRKNTRTKPKPVAGPAVSPTSGFTKRPKPMLPPKTPDLPAVVPTSDNGSTITQA